MNRKWIPLRETRVPSFPAVLENRRGSWFPIPGPAICGSPVASPCSCLFLGGSQPSPELCSFALQCFVGFPYFPPSNSSFFSGSGNGQPRCHIPCAPQDISKTTHCSCENRKAIPLRDRNKLSSGSFHVSFPASLAPASNIAQTPAVHILVA